MAFLTDCAGCAAGDHSRHTEVIQQFQNDANICDCAGDCAERLTKKKAYDQEQRLRARAGRIGAEIEHLRSEGYTVIPPEEAPSGVEEVTVHIRGREMTVFLRRAADLHSSQVVT